jgi:alpha-galactosidase
MRAVYQKMGDALHNAGRPILYSLCQYGRADVWRWGADVGGNAWRTTGDIRDSWDSMSRIGFSQDELAPWAKPGHWNDPDMLEIGNGGMSDDEYRTHMSLWSILAAPLLAGNDLRSMPSTVLEILTNRDVIAVNQDRDGRQGRRINKSGEQEVWARPLAGGDQAIGLFNRGGEAATIAVKWADVGFTATPRRARDLWKHTDLKVSGDAYSVRVPSHGVAMIRVSQ